ncbi:hypothetical protein ACFLZL_04215 [Thermodesulfobacteriota bacterium]
MKPKIIRYGYLFIFFLLALTGFGQMPIFKRYYIADLPGLGWLAKFYVTHYIHYLGAAVLFALTAYIIIDYLITKQDAIRCISLSGYVRVAILAVILISGVLLVIRNLPGYRFHPGFISFLDLSHLGMVMLYLVVSLYCLIYKKNWTT